MMDQGQLALPSKNVHNKCPLSQFFMKIFHSDTTKSGLCQTVLERSLHMLMVDELQSD